MATYQIKANQSTPINQVGRFFRIFSSKTALDVRIFAKGQEYFSGMLQSGIGLDFSDREQYSAPFDKIIVYTEEAQQINIWHSLAKADDSRLSGNFDINAALSVAQTAAKAHESKKLTISSATEVLPVRETRKAAVIQVSGAVYVDSVNGIVADDTFGWDNQAALKLIPVGGPVEVRINEDYD